MPSMAGPMLPPQFKMQRASTQLSINLNHHQPMRGNLNKNFGSSHDLKMLPEVRTIERKNMEKNRDLKKTRAPPPPNTSVVIQSNNSNRMKVRAYGLWSSLQGVTRAVKFVKAFL